MGAPQILALSFALFLNIAVLTLCYVQVFFRRVILGQKSKADQYREEPPTLRDPKWGKHSFAHLPDVKLHYVSKGNQNRPLLLLIHGFPEFWYSWRHQLHELSRDYWVVAVDLRGYGESDKPSGLKNYKAEILAADIRDLIKVLGRTKCIVAGHDWGGAIAWTVAIRHPEVVEKLIVLNCPHPSALQQLYKTSIKQKLMSWYMLAFQIPYLPEKIATSQIDWIFDNMFLVSEEAKKHSNSQDMLAYQYTFSRPHALTAPINFYRANKFLNIKYDDPTVRTPTLLIWGKNDVALSFALADMSAKFVEDMTLRTLDKASHFVQQDHPLQVCQLIRDFVN